MFDGTCIDTYPTSRMEIHVWYCTSVNCRSVSRPLRRALAKLFLSMKFRMKRRIRIGKMRLSILRTRDLSWLAVQVSVDLLVIWEIDGFLVSLESREVNMVKGSEL